MKNEWLRLGRDVCLTLYWGTVVFLVVLLISIPLGGVK